MDPTRRFSSRVENYVRFRPTYPRGVIEILVRECDLRPESRVADIGSGTGLLTTLYLEYGCEVTGVEPNREMRTAAERVLAGQSRFHSVDGRAEATALPDHSMDLVTAGQAFHWFDPSPTRLEFRRILRPDGWLALIWNERAQGTGFMAGYEDLVSRFGPERPKLRAHEFDRFFGEGSWQVRKLPHEQKLDFEGLQGRFLSSSYAPLPGTAEYDQLIAGLRQLFAAYQKDSRITLQYETEVYFGRLGNVAPEHRKLS